MSEMTWEEFISFMSGLERVNTSTLRYADGEEMTYNMQPIQCKMIKIEGSSKHLVQLSIQRQILSQCNVGKIFIRAIPEVNTYVNDYGEMKYRGYARIAVLPF